MANTHVITPKRGHRFDLAVMLFGLTILGILLGYVGYDFFFGGGNEAIRLAAVLVLAMPAFIVLAFRPGRYVFIFPEAGVAKPMWFRAKNPKPIPWEGIRSFERVYSVANREETVGIYVHTRDGRAFRYLEKRTPGCVSLLLDNLVHHGVHEWISAKKRFG